MHPLRAKYLITETAISVLINATISVGFVWLVFHGQDQIPPTGRGSLVRDAAPQTFMIALMSTLVPSFITRKRMHAGRLNAGVQTRAVPTSTTAGGIFLRALVFALIAMGVGLGISAAALPHALPNGLTYDRALIFKTAYGALIALIVTPFAITWALDDIGDETKLKEAK